MYVEEQNAVAHLHKLKRSMDEVEPLGGGRKQASTTDGRTGAEQCCSRRKYFLGVCEADVKSAEVPLRSTENDYYGCI